MFEYAGTVSKQRYEEYRKAIEKIQDATGVQDPNDIIQKFANQAETHENLTDLKKKSESKLLTLTEKK